MPEWHKSKPASHEATCFRKMGIFISFPILYIYIFSYFHFHFHLQFVLWCFIIYATLCRSFLLKLDVYWFLLFFNFSSGQCAICVFKEQDCICSAIWILWTI